MRLCRRLWPAACFACRFLLLSSKWGVVYQVSLMAPLWMAQLQYVVPVTLKVGQKYALDDFATNTCTHRTKSWPPGFYKDDLGAKTLYFMGTPSSSRLHRVRFFSARRHARSELPCAARSTAVLRKCSLNPPPPPVPATTHCFWCHAPPPPTPSSTAPSSYSASSGRAPAVTATPGNTQTRLPSMNPLRVWPPVLSVCSRR